MWFSAPIDFDLAPSATQTVSTFLPYAVQLSGLSALHMPPESRLDRLRSAIACSRLARRFPLLRRIAPRVIEDVSRKLGVSSFTIDGQEQLLNPADNYVPCEAMMSILQSVPFRVRPDKEIAFTLTNLTDKPVRGSLMLQGYRLDSSHPMLAGAC
jgi:hypothetical protein